MRIRFPWLLRPTPEAEPPTAPAPAEPRAVQHRTTDSVPVTFMSSEIPDVDSGFGYGHLDGRRGVSPENFRDFIGHTAEIDGIDGSLASLQESERELRMRAASIRERRAELAMQTDRLRFLTGRGDDARSVVEEAEKRFNESESHYTQHRSAGSMVQAALFLVAGLFFIGGDVVMAHAIVADALGIIGWEGWTFAIGLAMISVVLKPAYDRLVEKKYGEGNARRFAWVICLLALFSIGTLAILGAFRFESHGLTTEIGLLSKASEQNEAGARLIAIKQEMARSRLGFWSFVLSGVLFAAAGAVSLSIGLGYARSYWHVRRPAKVAFLEGGRTLEKARRHRDERVEEHANLRAEVDRLASLLGDELEPKDLEERADELAARRANLSENRVEVRTQRLRSIYADGYELGTILREDVSRSAAGEAEVPRRKRPRPFVALRRAIRETSLSKTSVTLN